MVSNEVVMQTVKRMLSSGIDDETIRNTLRSISTPEEQVEVIINEAKGISPQQAQQAKKVVQEAEDELEDADEDFEQDPIQNVSKDMQNMSIEQSAQHETTQKMLDEHSEKVAAVHQDVQKLHEKISAVPQIDVETIAKINAIDGRISSLESAVNETKANTKALQELLKKMIDTNKQILMELQKK